MQSFAHAQHILSTLALDPLLPGYSAITYALVDKTQGKLGAFVDASGNLNIGGLTSSTLCGGGGAVDLSGLTGVFKTPTGLTTIGGALAVQAVNTPVAAAGSTKNDAAALTTASVQTVSSDSSAKGVKLPAGVPGYELSLVNTTATACHLYPDAGGTINGGTVDASVTLPASKGNTCLCTAPSTWWVFDSTARSA